MAVDSLQVLCLFGLCKVLVFSEQKQEVLKNDMIRVECGALATVCGRQSTLQLMI